MKKNDAANRMRLLALMRERNMRLAQTSFAHFLGYINPVYRMEWYHSVIADYCQRLLDGEIKNLMVFIPPQHGKLLPSDTPVLTTKGWKKHGELTVGDEVFGQDGKRKKVLANSGVYEWDVTEITFQNGQKIEAAREHLWRIKADHDDHKGRVEEVIETQHIYDKRHRRSPYIDIAPALDMPQADLPIEPYILGLWLGDGLKNQGVVVSGDEDAEYMSQFGRAKLEREGYWRITIPNLRTRLREAGLLNNKHIPVEYILASKEQRTELLCGLMDTDGCVDKRGNAEFTQKSGRLADDVHVLLRTLGYKARKAEYDMTLNGRIVGKKTRILFNPNRDDVVFRLPRKAERLKNKTKADRSDKNKLFMQSISTDTRKVLGNCIQVEGSMYLAGYDLIPTHNSEIVSRNFPAWALGQNPDTKIVGCSYSADLAEQFSRSIQRTIDSQEYRNIFPETYLNGGGTSVRGYIRNVNIFEMVNHRGYYKAVGVGGGLTGTAVDIAIIDDPVKDAVEAYSETYRARVWDWYNSVLSTRLHNDSKQLFIMTRWHEDDLAGRILKREAKEWTVLKIPAICEVDGDGELNSVRHVGDALWEERHSIEKLTKYQTRAPKEFNALYQQRPTIEGGNIVRRDWFQRISENEFRNRRGRETINFYLDTAYDKRSKKKGVDNDPSGILAACRINHDIYLVHGCKMYKEMPELLTFLPQYMDMHGADMSSRLCIEPKANGKSVAQMLKNDSDLNVMFTETPTDSKEVRLRAVSPKIECGRVYMVEGAWNDDFLDEVCGFPSQPHDEYVDILGYAINDLFRDDAPAFSDDELEDIMY